MKSKSLRPIHRGLLAGLAGTLLVATACSGGSNAAQGAGARPPVPVRVAKATKGSIASNLSYSGELQPIDSVEVLAFATGRIQDMYVDEGAEVSAGSPLAMLETDALSAAVKQ